MFTATSASTSVNCSQSMPAKKTHGAVAKPITGSTSSDNVAPPIMVALVPNCSMTVAVRVLPITPPNAASASRSPMVPNPTSMRSRISGSRGMNDENTSPLIQNCAATATSARFSLVPYAGSLTDRPTAEPSPARS